MLKLSQGFCVGMAAFVSASAVAAPLQIPTSVPIVEVAQQTNTYNYVPVNENNSTIKRVVPISDALVTGQSVSDVEPKVSTTRRLPIGTGADVTAKVTIPKKNIAKALVATAKGVGKVALPGVAALALEALLDYGIKNIELGPDGALQGTKDVEDGFDVSDGRSWRNGSEATSYLSPRLSAEGLALQLTKNSGSTYTVSSCSIGSISAQSICTFKVKTANGMEGETTYTMAAYVNSDCPVGYFVVGSKCTKDKPASSLSEQQIEDAIASASGWPKSSSVVLAEMLQYPDTRKIIQDYPNNGVEINGPPSVKGKSTTSTESVQLLPGTNTVAPPGTPPSQTQPGTKTTTTTATHPITYSGNSVSHSTVNNTTTNITNNVTNVTTTETKTEEIEDDKDDQMPADTALGYLPKLYEQKYPEGLAGVWNQRSQEFKSSGLFSLAEQLMPTSLNGGTCPSFSMDLSIGPWADYGTHEVPMPCWIWDTCKYILLLMAAVSARRIVFGG